MRRGAASGSASLSCRRSGGASAGSTACWLRRRSPCQPWVRGTYHQGFHLAEQGITRGDQLPADRTTAANPVCVRSCHQCGHMANAASAGAECTGW